MKAPSRSLNEVSLLVMLVNGGGPVVLALAPGVLGDTGRCKRPAVLVPARDFVMLQDEGAPAVLADASQAVHRC